MYAGPVIDAHMHLWDLANGYTWLSKPNPAFERLIGNYDRLRRNSLASDYIAMTHQAVATFGAARCMFGSNCPPDTLYYEFGQLLDTYCGAFSSPWASEQQDIFRGTAQRVYRL